LNRDGKIAKKRFNVLIFILVSIDQIVKIVISKLFFEPHVHIDFIDNILYFCPMQNTDGVNIVVRRIATSLFKIDTANPPFVLRIALPLLALGIILFVSLYFAYLSKKYHSFIYYSLIFVISGIICRLIDDIFWGGSIDYIGLFNWFVFDFKDAYITTWQIFMLLIVVRYLRDYYKLDKKERKQQSKGFFNWLKKGCRLNQCRE